MTTCLGIKVNGARCSSNAKNEQTYCGRHKAQELKAALAKADKNELTDKRLLNLIAAGAGLITIMEKAIEYLPPLLDFCCMKEASAAIEIRSELTPKEFHEVYGYHTECEEEITLGTIIQKLKRAILLNNQGDIESFTEELQDYRDDHSELWKRSSIFDE